MEEWLIIYLFAVLAVLAFFALFLFHELVLKGNDPGTYQPFPPSSTRSTGSMPDEDFGLLLKDLPKPDWRGQITIDGITYDRYYGDPLDRNQCFYNSIVTSMKITDGVNMSMAELRRRMKDAIISSKGNIETLAVLTDDPAKTEQDMLNDLRNLSSYSDMNDMEEPVLKVSEATGARVHLHVKDKDTGLITKRPTVYTPQDDPDTDIDIHLLHVNGNHYDFLIPTEMNPLNKSRR